MTAKKKPELKLPPCLRPGDRVGVVAPAGPVDADVLEKGLRSIARMGWTPVLGRHVGSRERFLAGSDAERAEDLMRMFADPGIRAIFCARGGYGVNRVLPLLHAAKIRRHPKIVVGASDITLLLLYLSQRCSLVAFHGPMVAGSFGRYAMKKTRGQFRDLLTGQPGATRLQWPGARALCEGRAQGPLTGGCLTLLCRSLGTPYEVDTRGKILVIEDVNEPPYKVDGMLWQLRAAGKFKDVKGVIVGEMVGCGKGPAAKRWLDESFREVFSGGGIPVVTNFPLGHGREMWTLPLGVDATLDAETLILSLASCGVV